MSLIKRTGQAVPPSIQPTQKKQKFSEKVDIISKINIVVAVYCLNFTSDTDLINCSIVSKQWREVIRERDLRTRILRYGKNTPWTFINFNVGFQGVCVWDSVPIEMKHYVCGFLPFVDLIRCRQLSRDWKEITDTLLVEDIRKANRIEDKTLEELVLQLYKEKLITQSLLCTPSLKEKIDKAVELVCTRFQEDNGLFEPVNLFEKLTSVFFNHLKSIVLKIAYVESATKCINELSKAGFFQFAIKTFYQQTPETDFNLHYPPLAIEVLSWIARPEIKINSGLDILARKQKNKEFITGTNGNGEYFICFAQSIVLLNMKERLWYTVSKVQEKIEDFIRILRSVGYTTLNINKELNATLNLAHNSGKDKPWWENAKYVYPDRYDKLFPCPRSKIKFVHIDEASSRFWEEHDKQQKACDAWDLTSRDL